MSPGSNLPDSGGGKLGSIARPSVGRPSGLFVRLFVSSHSFVVFLLNSWRFSLSRKVSCAGGLVGMGMGTMVGGVGWLVAGEGAGGRG